MSSDEMLPWEDVYAGTYEPWRDRGGVLPWEDGLMPADLTLAVSKHVPQGSLVYDVGCGLGTVTRFLAANGWRAVGIDVSPTAITKAREMTPSELAAAASFEVADLLAGERPQELADAVVDRGLLHNGEDHEMRRAFAAAEAAVLRPGGVWVCMAGRPGDLNTTRRHPDITLSELVCAVEGYFDVLEVRQATFGSETGRTDFGCWLAVGLRL